MVASLNGLAPQSCRFLRSASGRPPPLHLSSHSSKRQYVWCVEGRADPLLSFLCQLDAGWRNRSSSVPALVNCIGSAWSARWQYALITPRCCSCAWSAGGWPGTTCATKWFGADHRWSIKKPLALIKVVINQCIDVNFPVRYCPQQSCAGCPCHAQDPVRSRVDPVPAVWGAPRLRDGSQDPGLPLRRSIDQSPVARRARPADDANSSSARMVDDTQRRGVLLGEFALANSCA